MTALPKRSLQTGSNVFTAISLITSPKLGFGSAGAFA